MVGDEHEPILGDCMELFPECGSGAKPVLRGLGGEAHRSIQDFTSICVLLGEKINESLGKIKQLGNT